MVGTLHEDNAVDIIHRCQHLLLAVIHRFAHKRSLAPHARLSEAERSRSAAGAALPPTSHWVAELQRAAVPPVRLQSTRGSLPPPLLQNRA